MLFDAVQESIGNALSSARPRLRSFMWLQDTPFREGSANQYWEAGLWAAFRPSNAPLGESATTVSAAPAPPVAGIRPVKRRSMKLGEVRPVAGAGRCPSAGPLRERSNQKEGMRVFRPVGRSGQICGRS
jgi:hypothetical protein